MAIRYATDDDSGTSGGTSTSGNVGGTGGAPPPIGTVRVFSKRFLDANWIYNEPQPTGFTKGFEVVAFIGGVDPDDPAAILCAPIEFMADPTARRWVRLLELRSQVDMKVAIRTVFTDTKKSAWIVSAAATFTVDVAVVSDDSGYRKLADGTIIQWVKGPIITGQNNTDVLWPIPFPNQCFWAGISTQPIDSIPGNDAWFQIIAKDVNKAVILRNATSATADGYHSVPFLLGIGY